MPVEAIVVLFVYINLDGFVTCFSHLLWDTGIQSLLCYTVRCRRILTLANKSFQP